MVELVTFIMAVAVAVSFSALCLVLSLAVIDWSRRADHKFKIGILKTNKHSWEEFDMVNKEQFETDYWRTFDNGKDSVRVED